MFNQKGSTIILVVILLLIVPLVSLFIFNEENIRYKLTDLSLKKANAEYASYSGVVFAGNYDQTNLNNLTGTKKFYLNDSQTLYFTLEYLSEEDAYVSTGYYLGIIYKYYFRN